MLDAGCFTIPPKPSLLPDPSERRASELRLLPPGPSQVRSANVVHNPPTGVAPRPSAPEDEYSSPGLRGVWWSSAPHIGFRPVL